MTPKVKIPKKKKGTVAPKQKIAKAQKANPVLSAIAELNGKITNLQKAHVEEIAELRGRIGNHGLIIESHQSNITDLIGHKESTMDVVDFTRNVKNRLGSDLINGQNYPISKQTALRIADAAGSPGYVMGLWGITLGASGLLTAIQLTIPAVLVFFVGAGVSIIGTVMVLTGHSIVEEK